jgi:hypothetical protein
MIRQKPLAQPNTERPHHSPRRALLKSRARSEISKWDALGPAPRLEERIMTTYFVERAGSQWSYYTYEQGRKVSVSRKAAKKAVARGGQIIFVP